MTTRHKSLLNSEGRRKLTLGKLTLRDLTIPGAGPKGGRVRLSVTETCPPPQTLYCGQTVGFAKTTR